MTIEDRLDILIEQGSKIIKLLEDIKGKSADQTYVPYPAQPYICPPNCPWPSPYEPWKQPYYTTTTTGDSKESKTVLHG